MPKTPWNPYKKITFTPAPVGGAFEGGLIESNIPDAPVGENGNEIKVDVADKKYYIFVSFGDHLATDTEEKAIKAAQSLAQEYSHHQTSVIVTKAIAVVKANPITYTVEKMEN